VQRIFITLNGVDESFTMQNPVVETGDFSHSFEFATTNSADEQGVFGHIAAQFNFLRLRADGRFQIRTATGTALTFNTPASTNQDGALNTGTISRVSGVISLSVNGEDLGSMADSGTFTVSILFASANTTVPVSFFDGVGANVDLGNGNAWPINQATSNTEQSAGGGNLLTYVGSPDTELFTLNTSTTPDQWENDDKSRIIQIA
jgi:hypothetical protein